MNYLQDRKTVFKNQDKKRSAFRPGVILVILVLLFLGGQVFFSFFSTPLVIATAPLLARNTSWGAAIFSLTDFFSTKKTLILDNKRLRESLTLVQTKVLEQQIKLQDLAEISSLLPSDNSDFVSVGEVIARPLILPYDLLLVRLPVDHSVEAGQKVMWRENILLGEVLRVDQNIAKIKLYSSANVKQQVLIGEAGIQGVMEGSGGGNFIIMLPRGVEIPLLDKVYLASNPNKVLGVVEKTINQPENPSQKIYVRVPVNIYTLTWVSIYDF